MARPAVALPVPREAGVSTCDVLLWSSGVVYVLILKLFYGITGVF
jgi:hypothetical protein